MMTARARFGVLTLAALLGGRRSTPFVSSFAAQFTAQLQRRKDKQHLELRRSQSYVQGCLIGEWGSNIIGKVGNFDSLSCSRVDWKEFESQSVSVRKRGASDVAKSLREV